MIQEESKKNRKINGRIIDFMEYKKKKPFFTPPMKIDVGNPINETYQLVKNIQYKDKQIIAMRKEDDPKTIIVVEAKIQDGKIEDISMVPETLLEELKQVLKESLT
jgi:hypothetical protein